MKFDNFTIALLILRPDAPRLDEKQANALQDAHLGYLASLHEDGFLLAAGPLLGPGGREFRGLCIFKVGTEETKELTSRDPAVRAGRFSVKIMPWMVPGGAISFEQTRFPHSITQADQG